jgi:hypothetical protein
MRLAVSSYLARSSRSGLWPHNDPMDDISPLKELARALRRHHVERVKKNRSGYWGRDRSDIDPLTERQLGILASTPAMCSGYCCGSPRKWFGELSMQERRGHARADQACQEMGLGQALRARESST